MRPLGSKEVIHHGQVLVIPRLWNKTSQRASEKEDNSFLILAWVSFKDLPEDAISPWHWDGDQQKLGCNVISMDHSDNSHWIQGRALGTIKDKILTGYNELFMENHGTLKFNNQATSIYWSTNRGNTGWLRCDHPFLRTYLLIWITVQPVLFYIIIRRD